MEIDDDSFRLLNEEPELIAEVFPRPGIRLKFKNKYCEYLKEQVL